MRFGETNCPASLAMNNFMILFGATVMEEINISKKYEGHDYLGDSRLYE